MPYNSIKALVAMKSCKCYFRTEERNKYSVLYNLGFDNYDPIPDLAQICGISNY